MLIALLQNITVGYILQNKINNPNTLKKKKLWRRINPKTSPKKDKPVFKLKLSQTFLKSSLSFSEGSIAPLLKADEHLI